MTRIAVSANSLVDYSPDRWRLIQVDDPADPKLVVEAKTGVPFRYNGYFAVSRDLPESGEILKADLGQVVLGWSKVSRSWQLGVTLSPEVSLARSSRWFELLRFTNPDATVFEETATQLGEALATTLGVPFVPSTPTVEPEPEPEPIPLAPLPLDLGLWRLEEVHSKRGVDGELRLIREKRWLRARQRQIAWYGLLTLVYIWVSVATLTSELGLPNAGTLIPNPQWLPYLGIAVAGLLALVLIRQIWTIQREPNTIVVNPYEKSISAMRGGHLRWKVNAGSVQSVYASELVNKRGRRPTVYHGEINLHLLDGRFMPLMVDREKIADALLPGCDPFVEKARPVGVNVLEPDEVSTSLQAAAVHIAVCLGDLAIWYDRRFK